MNNVLEKKTGSHDVDSDMKDNEGKYRSENSTLVKMRSKSIVEVTRGKDDESGNGKV